MAGKGSSAVFLALAGNAFLTVIKFIAFLFSGSGAMLSESIHSLADTGNQGLLYFGIRKSERPADAMFHYGYGADRFFFAFMSAIGIFVLGCGVTIYHGIEGLIHPPELKLDWLVFVVLAVSFLVEAFVLAKAMQTVAAQKGKQSFFQYVRTSSDPTLLAVLFEDAVACLGVLVAAAGILLSYFTGSPVFDALSSILIGLMLGAIAIWLGFRNRQLILGPAIPKELERDVVALIEDQPSVTSVHDIKTRVLAAGRFRLKAEIDYDGRFLARTHLDWAKQSIGKLKDDAATEGFVEEFGERMLKSLADEIDRIENGISKQFPHMSHLDLESHWTAEGDSG